MQVDCGPLVYGLKQHSYFTNGRIARDIRLSLQGVSPEDAARALYRLPGAPTMWRF